VVKVYVFIPGNRTPTKFILRNITNARLFAKRLRVLGLMFEVETDSAEDLTAQQALERLAHYTPIHPLITRAIETKIRGNKWLTQLLTFVPLAKT
jgi:hypothetical protein